MFSEVFLIYLVTRLDKLLSLTNGIVIISAFVYLASAMAFAITFDDKNFRKEISDTMKKWAFIPLIALVVGVIVPSKDDMKFIIAGTGLVEIAKSDTAQRVASKSVQIVEQYLDSLLKEEKK